jgi:hypothetical protein
MKMVIILIIIIMMPSTPMPIGFMEKEKKRAH